MSIHDRGIPVIIRITDLEFDDYNEAELARHGIAMTEVWQVLSNRYTLKRNKKAGTGDRRMVGETHGGRILTVVLARTPTPGLWRPITAWDSTGDEKGWLQ